MLQSLARGGKGSERVRGGGVSGRGRCVLRQAADGTRQVVNGFDLPLLQCFLLRPHVQLALLELQVQLQNVSGRASGGGASGEGGCGQDGRIAFTLHGFAQLGVTQLGFVPSLDVLVAAAENLMHGAEELPVYGVRSQTLGAFAVLPVGRQHVPPLQVALKGSGRGVRVTLGS